MSPTGTGENEPAQQTGTPGPGFVPDQARAEALAVLHSLHDQLQDLKLVAANTTTAIKEVSSPYTPPDLDFGIDHEIGSGSPDPMTTRTLLPARPTRKLGPKIPVSTTRVLPALGPTITVTAPDADFKPGFPLFMSLPAELRTQIWQNTFLPRTIEVHAPRRPHYAEQGHVTWRTRCLPHPALLVCHESRELALRHYYLSFLQPHSTGAPHMYNQLIRFNPVTDLLLVLGELDISRLKVLLTHFERTDPAGIGLRRLGLNAACWEYNGAGRAMRIWSRNIFRMFEEFVLVLYAEPSPPPEWEGGVVKFEDPEGTELYESYARGKARELREDGKWMVVGKNRLTVKAVKFINGW